MTTGDHPQPDPDQPALPESVLHRECWGVSPYKYHSEPRRLTLQRAVEGLVLAAVFQRLFGKAIFPRFATVACRR